MQRRVFESFVVLVGVVLLSSCGMIFEHTDHFVIRVDSITGPTAVSGGAAFEQRVWGHVGNDGCSRFTEFQVNRAPTRLDLTVKGARRTGRDILCYSIIVDLPGEPLRIEPPTPVGSFTIAVHQPDGSLLTRVIRSE